MTDQHPNQKVIWDHFSAGDAEVFAGSRPRLEYLGRQVFKNAKTARPKVLNVGIGNGTLESFIRARGGVPVSLDISDVAVRRQLELGFDAKQGTITDPPFEKESFDFVVASEVLEHLSQSERHQAQRAVSGLLKPNGCFLGTVPFNENLADNIAVCPCCGHQFHRWGHQQSYTVETLRAELSEHFVPNEVAIRTFVDLRRRGLVGKAKSTARLLLGYLKQPIALSNIYFRAGLR